MTRLFILVIGDYITGFDYIGPFSTAEAAISYAEAHHLTLFQTAILQQPEIPQP